MKAGFYGYTFPSEVTALCYFSYIEIYSEPFLFLTDSLQIYTHCFFLQWLSNDISIFDFYFHFTFIDKHFCLKNNFKTDSLMPVKHKHK